MATGNLSDSLEATVSGAWVRATWDGRHAVFSGCTHLLQSARSSVNGAPSSGLIWTEWTTDQTSVTLRSDPFGFYPLFYHSTLNEFVASPSIATLLSRGAPPELDSAALAVFLRLGFFVGDDTPFKSIRALPPSGHLKWSKGRCDISGHYWIPKLQRLSREAAIDLYAATFREALRTLASGDEPRACPLSGGRDSRHILLALCELGHPPAVCPTVRYDLPAPDEHLVAATLAALVGVKHVVLEPNPDPFEAEKRKNVLTHFSTFEHAWILPLQSYLAAERYEVIYDGIGGDVLSAGLYLDHRTLELFESGRFEELSETLLGDEGYLPSLLPAPAYRCFTRPLAVERLMRELHRHASAPNPVGSFYFWNRTRRGVAASPFGILRPVAEILTPYLAPPVYEFLASLPASIYLDHQFHTQTIARAFPRYASVPYASKEAPVSDGRRSYRGVASDLLRDTARARGTLLQRTAVAVRALRGIVDRRYGASVIGIAPLAAYLLQLEGLGAVTDRGHEI